ncbi:maleylpyruvate isomerase N-terminal domain-containing protein [Dyadobacter psychrophilus]|uniref:Mycothiol maleylpyruvate isomerase N-terminal domain-containing protein n=1 Tax=Dyadobacter psychrophilus TaxID=651661 RepID=A0A1T5GDL9_9BACT|nr:maleylpyruvate isomerase N-terminal domain-containing protein [Dyadobacter psychrophilus]SKC06489.1 Mycothiol maleylpyruvate isomerase N-terminal domain-containing protein [Dyadobacter psychrophilus]
MIETVHLFPVLDQKLIELLKSLSYEDWHKTTVARMWNVKDVASHLLDGNLRVISGSRDNYNVPPDREINSYEDLVAFLNKLNHDWVQATKRLSPAILIDLLESTGKEYSLIMSEQDMHREAKFSVAWAGEQTSKNWFHIAREYTEKWHHQQQIREATGKQGIITEALYLPFVDTLLRGLPHTYRNVDAQAGTAIVIDVGLEQPFERFLIKEQNGWKIENHYSGETNASIRIPPETAWKLFTKAIKPEEAEENITIGGDSDLAKVALNLIAVMA